MVPRALRNLVSRPATRRYPTEIRPHFAATRGAIEFDVDSCVFCMLCARRCPAVAITCSREDRFWAIDQLTCIACGVCVEVCNKNSLSMSVASRRVHTRTEVSPDGRRPGREEWSKPVPAAPTAPVVATPGGRAAEAG
jgi:formate hydrogenlyase subunit 6/NADH:ubiquinone oxidoreductase subunit I